MKKVVLSLALVAMMFVSCKEAEANAEEMTTETVETVEATTEEAVETIDSTATAGVEAVEETAAKVEEVAK